MSKQPTLIGRRIAPGTHKRRSADRKAAMRLGNARDALAGLKPGDAVCGFTKGAFSMIDLLKALLDITGPAAVVVSTWTTGVRDADNVRFMLDGGQMTSFRLLTDRSFPIRQPKYCDKVLRLFGDDSIICTNTHAKFALVKNDKWSIVVRSSMNLNRNMRFEQFDLDDNASLYAFFGEIVDELCDTHVCGAVSARSIVDKQFKAAFSSKRQAEKEHRDPAEVDLDAMLADLPPNDFGE